MSKISVQIKDALEKLYARYNRREFIETDPLLFVYRYSERADMEIAAFLAAELAYGRVQQIQKSLTDLLARMGDSPAAFVKNLDNKKRQKLKDFKHRFTTGDDIADLLQSLGGLLKKFESIENLFAAGCSRNDQNITKALTTFCDSILKSYTKLHNKPPTKGLCYLLPRPADGSACKRLTMFLRWMVRKDDVDPGLWKSIKKSMLIVPLDVHMTRLCRILGLYNQKTVSWSTAVKITGGFAALEPADPVKYDFALSRIGIVEDCKGSYRPQCRDCELFGLCCRRRS